MLRLPNRLVPRGKPRWMLAAGAILLLALTSFFLFRTVQGERDTVRLCLGEEVVLQEDFVRTLQAEAAKCHLNLILTPGTRGEHTVNRVASGEFDVAIVFGGLGVEHPDVRQVACLRGEPLHLFVKPALAPLGLAGLLGKRVNVGPHNGETQVTAKRVLRHMDVKEDTDFRQEHHDLQELLTLKEEELPDAIFLSAGLPSPSARTLVHRLGYRLLEVPFGEVLALKNPSVYDVTIPANTYGYHPAVPEKPIHTVGCHTMVIANRSVSARAVYRMLELLCESDFPRRIGKAPLDMATLLRVRDFPLHAGATHYLTRNDPWMSQKLIERFGKMKELLISGVSARLLFWGWLRRRPKLDYEPFFRQAALLELESCRAAEGGVLDEAGQESALAAVLRLKIDALEKHGAGLLPGDQQMRDFLARLEQIQAALRALPTQTARETLRAAG